MKLLPEGVIIRSFDQITQRVVTDLVNIVLKDL